MLYIHYTYTHTHTQMQRYDRKRVRLAGARKHNLAKAETVHGDETLRLIQVLAFIDTTGPAPTTKAPQEYHSPFPTSTPLPRFPVPPASLFLFYTLITGVVAAGVPGGGLLVAFQDNAPTLWLAMPQPRARALLIFARPTPRLLNNSRHMSFLREIARSGFISRLAPSHVSGGCCVILGPNDFNVSYAAREPRVFF